VDLGFHHRASTQLFGNPTGFRRIVGHSAARHCNPVATQQFFGLVLVNLQRVSSFPVPKNTVPNRAGL
jgi:hypothetical protein